MRGKIVSSGVIMADDGKKYFYVGEFAINALVEFEAQDDRAINVTVVQSQSCLSSELPFINNAFVFWDLRKVRDSFSTMNIHSIKFFSFCALIISFLSGLAYGTDFSGGVFVWGFVSFLCVFWAVFSLCHLSSNYVLMQAFFLVMALGVILSFLATGSAVSMFFSRSTAYLLTTLLVIVFIICMICYVLYMKILAKMTREPFFLYSLFATVLALTFFGISTMRFVRGGFTTLIVLAGICAFVSFVFYLLALLRFRELSIAKEATLKSEFLDISKLFSYLKKS